MYGFSFRLFYDSDNCWALAHLGLCKGDASSMSRFKPQQELFILTLEFPKGLTRTVKVKASNRETAERRALKRNPTAIGVKS